MNPLILTLWALPLALCSLVFARWFLLVGSPSLLSRPCKLTRPGSLTFDGWLFAFRLWRILNFRFVLSIKKHKSYEKLDGLPVPPFFLLLLSLVAGLFAFGFCCFAVITLFLTVATRILHGRFFPSRRFRARGLFDESRLAFL